MVTPRRAGWLESLLPFLPAIVWGVCALGFVGKPFHLDDPMYFWAARHIADHPLDFYGFTVNWYGVTQPMAEVMQNPPLVSYYLALTGSLFGWSETILHVALFLPAVGVILGTQALARQVDAPAVPAALIVALSPGFFVSSTTVMCDVATLCSWVWAVVLWVRGIREERHALLAGAAILVAAAALTKYVGVALLPLLAAYALMKGRRSWPRLLWLLLPAIILVAYELWTQRLYGRGLLFQSMAYAREVRGEPETRLAPKLLAGLSFTGAMHAAAFVAWPTTRSRRVWGSWALAGFALFALFMALPANTALIGTEVGHGKFRVPPDLPRASYAAQLAVAVAGGACLLALGAVAAARRRTAEAGLLLLWVLGIFAFGAVFNWTVNVRSLLPMTPAVGLLVAARLRGWDGPRRALATAAVLVPSAALSLWVAWADLALASSAREAASTIASRLPGERVWFQGHWGFQYYAEANGLLPVDVERSAARPGDHLVLPLNNTNVFGPPEGGARLVGRLVESPLPGVTTLSRGLGAGFYSDTSGQLPFTIGKPPPEVYEVYRLEGAVSGRPTGGASVGGTQSGAAPDR